MPGYGAESILKKSAVSKDKNVQSFVKAADLFKEWGSPGQELTVLEGGFHHLQKVFLRVVMGKPALPKPCLKKWGEGASRPGLNSFPDWAWLAAFASCRAPAAGQPLGWLWGLGITWTSSGVWNGEWGSSLIHWWQPAARLYPLLRLSCPAPVARRCPPCSVTCLTLQERTYLRGWPRTCVEKSLPRPSAPIPDFLKLMWRLLVLT